MKKLIVAGISMVALATAAQPVAAADLPVAYRVPLLMNYVAAPIDIFLCMANRTRPPTRIADFLRAA
jgi:hypothetical protein